MDTKIPVASSREEIRERLLNTPLKIGQIDVNGKCNAKCWFCPVAYEGNPEKFAVQMPIEDLDHILGNLRTSKVLPPEFEFLYTSNYNEVLMYRHFDEMIPVFRKHGFRTLILSNGTPLTPRKTDVIKAKEDVIAGICLNIPAFEQDDWTKKVGLAASVHKQLMKNLDYLHERYAATIQINADPDQQFIMKNGFHETREDVDRIASQFRERYPNFNVYILDSLSDRAGILEKYDVLTRKSPLPVFSFGTKSLQESTNWSTWASWRLSSGIDPVEIFDVLVRNGFLLASIRELFGERYPSNREKWMSDQVLINSGEKLRNIIGCAHSASDGGRIYGWIHIAPTGDLFLCCDDYEMEFCFGNLLEKSFDDIWLSDEHVHAIERAHQSLCQGCNYRIEAPLA